MAGLALSGSCWATKCLSGAGEDHSQSRCPSHLLDGPASSGSSLGTRKATILLWPLPASVWTTYDFMYDDSAAHQAAYFCVVQNMAALSLADLGRVAWAPSTMRGAHCTRAEVQAPKQLQKCAPPSACIAGLQTLMSIDAAVHTCCLLPLLGRHLGEHGVVSHGVIVKGHVDKVHDPAILIRKHCRQRQGLSPVSAGHTGGAPASMQLKSP